MCRAGGDAAGGGEARGRRGDAGGSDRRPNGEHGGDGVRGTARDEVEGVVCRCLRKRLALFRPC